jgi:hypothetical protein
MRKAFGHLAASFSRFPEEPSRPFADRPIAELSPRRLCAWTKILLLLSWTFKKGIFEEIY